MKTNDESQFAVEFGKIMSAANQLNTGRIALSIIQSDAGKPLLVICQKGMKEASAIIVPVSTVNSLFIPSIQGVVDAHENTNRN